MAVSDFSLLIDNALAKFSSELPADPGNLYEPVSYILSLGGKRMRPKLLLMACEMFGGNIENALPAAVAMEVFHNFSLLHDDIMDNAPLRRSKPTVHEKWNANIAILSGDAMLVKSYQLLSKCKTDQLKVILEIFNETALGVCEGQQFDMNFEIESNVTIPDYIKMIELKTAVLLAGSLKIGALLGNATEADQHNIYEFGRNIGIAFQLQDDILDVYGDPEKFGKQVGGDIIANKKTYLLLSAMEKAKGELKTNLLKQISIKEFSSKEKVKAVISIYDQLGIKELATKEMLIYFEKALSHLSKTNVDSGKKKPFEVLAESLMVREF